MERFEKGDIVWFQGHYKCRVVEDRGNQIDYVPLEGFAPHQKGQTFTAEAIFFSKQKESLAEREAQLKEALEENKSLHALMISAEKRGVEKGTAELEVLKHALEEARVALESVVHSPERAWHGWLCVRDKALTTINSVLGLRKPLKASALDSKPWWVKSNATPMGEP